MSRAKSICVLAGGANLDSSTAAAETVEHKARGKPSQRALQARIRAHLDGATLVSCSRIGWAFVAPHLASGEARRGSIAAVLCDRGATKPEAKGDATLWAASLFGSDFVVCSLQTAEGYARRSRLV